MQKHFESLGAIAKRETNRGLDLEATMMRRGLPFEVDQTTRLADDWLRELPEGACPTLLWMFIGAAGTGSKLHLDVGYSSAWNAQILGRKRWWLFPPEQGHLLEEVEEEGDAFPLDPERFSGLAQARPLEAVVEPGEILFTPSMW
ncbi:MAG: cupin-like domain-containing protein [Chloroflexi bacterium]|nr:cupin-like domain-containing protein [Chloroflexota bacterium]